MQKGKLLIFSLTIVGLTIMGTQAAATTCGNGAWWYDIEKNLIAKWDNSSKGLQKFKELKRDYDSKEATLIDANHNVTKGFCKNYFGVDSSQQSCCSSSDYTQMINLMVRMTINATVPESKGDLCRSSMKRLDQSLRNCSRINRPQNDSSSIEKKQNITIAKQQRQDSVIGQNGTVGSGKQGDEKGSSKPSNIPPSSNEKSSGFLEKKGEKQGETESSRKLRDIAEKAGKAAEAKSKQLLAKLALGIARQLRGSLCAVCGDPDAASSLFDPVSKVWILNEKAYSDHAQLVQEILNSTRSSNQQCLSFLQYRRAQWGKEEKRQRTAVANNTTNSTEGTEEIAVCAAADAILTEAKEALFPCESDEECAQAAKDCVNNPLGTACFEEITEEIPDEQEEEEEVQHSEPSQFNSTENSTVASNGTAVNGTNRFRILAEDYKVNYQLSSQGGAAAIVDSDDQSLSVAGQEVQSIEAEANSTIADFESVGGKVDFSAALNETDNDVALNGDVESDTASGSLLQSSLMMALLFLIFSVLAL